MKLLLVVVFSIFLFASFAHGQLRAEIICEPLIRSGHFNATAKSIFNRQIGWSKNAWQFDCSGDHRENCLSYIEERFLKMTDNFNLTARDADNVTLGQAFCNEFPNVPKSKLMIGKSFTCSSLNAVYKDQAFSDIYSKQKLECINGKAFFTDAGGLVTAQVATILSILSVSLSFALWRI